MLAPELAAERLASVRGAAPALRIRAFCIALFTARCKIGSTVVASSRGQHLKKLIEEACSSAHHSDESVSAFSECQLSNREARSDPLDANEAAEASPELTRAEQRSRFPRMPLRPFALYRHADKLIEVNRRVAQRAVQRTQEQLDIYNTAVMPW